MATKVGAKKNTNDESQSHRPEKPVKKERPAPATAMTEKMKTA